MSIAMPPGDWHALRPELAALHLLGLALLIAVILAWGRHDGRRLLVASGLIAVAAILFTYLVTVSPSDIPIDWINILHHGLERKNIMQLYTRGAHAGANFAFVLAVTAAHAPNLHDVVWLNLLLALVNAAIFFHLAVPVTGLRWAIPWTLVFALNPATFLASFSELPSNLLGLYLLAGVIAWVVLHDPQPQPRLLRAAAYGLCVVLTVLVGITRFEVAVIGALALALHTTHTLIGADAWRAAGRRLRPAAERPLVFLSDHPAAVVGLCILGWGLSKTGVPGVIGKSQAVTLYPFYPAIFSLPAYLPMLALPIGVSVAFLFGFVHITVHFRRFGGLALSLAMLANAYFAAWFEYFEMGRYVSYILPAVFLVALFGKGELEERLRRLAHPTWGRAVRVAYLMAWFTVPLPGVLEYYTRPEYRSDGGFSQLLLDRDTQREVRHLLALTEQNPQCVFVGRVIEDQHGDPKVATQYDYVVFGASVTEPTIVPETETSLDAFIGRYAARAPCVRLYYGSDCNLTFADRCTEFIAGRHQVDAQRFWARPYNNPRQSGYAAPEIVLATYAWP